MVSFSEMFAEARSTHIAWDGGEIYGLYEFDSLPTAFDIQFVNFAAEPIQGLRMKIRGGKLTVGDVEHDEIVLWTDTAPSYVDVKVDGLHGSVLRVWNVWRTASGIEHAWLNNAAMKIEHPSNEEVLLRCSDGVGGSDFDDLVVRVTVSS